MRNLTSALCRGLTVGGVLLFGIAAHAQSYNTSQTYVQIQGEAAATPQPIPQGQSTDPGAYQSTPTYDQGVYSDGSYCPDCQQGAMGCGPRRGFGFRVAQFIDWFNPYGMCVHSPDHGFCPPAKRPIYRTPVAYTNFYPPQGGPQCGIQVTGTQPNSGVQHVDHQQAALQQAGYNPAGYSGVNGYGYRPHTVYWPTDTTQLGYYYQQVPRWMPNPAMIPGPPNPAEWHQTACGQGQCNQCNTARPVRRGIRVIGTPEILPYPGQSGYAAEAYCPPAPEGSPTPTYADDSNSKVAPIPAEPALTPTPSPDLLPVAP